MVALLLLGGVDLARADGGSGGDRESAGGAFMSSYTRGPDTGTPRAFPTQAPNFEPFATGSIAAPAIAPARPARRIHPAR